MACRILVVDDAIFFRRLVRSRLEAEPGMTVVGEARDGKEAVSLAEQFQPDVVVIDGAMPLMDGVEALPLIREVAPSCRIVFMSAQDGMLEEAMKVGADAAIHKGDSLKVCVEEVSVALDEHDREHSSAV
jgi:two-component system, chemotaxis family, chemotaxis protein CheY